MIHYLIMFWFIMIQYSVTVLVRHGGEFLGSVFGLAMSTLSIFICVLAHNATFKVGN